jgi:hypothetical protein
VLEAVFAVGVVDDGARNDGEWRRVRERLERQLAGASAEDAEGRDRVKELKRKLREHNSGHKRRLKRLRDNARRQVKEALK